MQLLLEYLDPPPPAIPTPPPWDRLDEAVRVVASKFSHASSPACSRQSSRRRQAMTEHAKITGNQRGLSTRCLRFKCGVATTHVRLASGWLASLYREGVEPSGSLRKVSELLHLFPPSWIYPDATCS
jgi:hypothetical protein